MADTPFFDFEINVEDMLQDIEVVEEKVEETKETIVELQKQSIKAVRRTISMARIGWGMIQGMIRASGGAISMTQRLVVSAAFGAVQALYPILYAAMHGGIASMNTAAVSSALMGIVELSTALGALAAYESGQRELSLRLRGLNFTMSNMGLMLSTSSI